MYIVDIYNVDTSNFTTYCVEFIKFIRLLLYPFSIKSIIDESPKVKVDFFFTFLHSQLVLIKYTDLLHGGENINFD